MFNSIRGIVSEKLSDSVYILNGGMDWEISVPATDLARLPPPGEEARVFTWLLHREDQMRLFGFADEVRRNTFLELLKVEGIGPRGAIRIMGGIGQEELERALETGDLGRLEQVPGLGKKTAQKMLLALKGKLVHKADTTEHQGGPYADLVKALEEMGYDRRAASDAVTRAEESVSVELKGTEKEQAIFRNAIVALSGGV
jgi:Holliday junction DNA helicase RuvA